jgi:hypothetical protein
MTRCASFFALLKKSMTGDIFRFKNLAPLSKLYPFSSFEIMKQRQQKTSTASRSINTTVSITTVNEQSNSNTQEHHASHVTIIISV